MIIKKTTEESVDELRARIALSIFVIYTFVLISIYNLSMEIVDFFQKDDRPSTYVTALALIIYSVFLFFMVRQMKYPLSFFGFNLNRWKQYLLESLILTALFAWHC